MRRIRTTLPALVLVLAFAGTAPVASAANTFQKIFFEYQGTGTVNGCKWSAKQLADAKKQVPNDFEQYAPDFEAALDAAIEKRASGACRKGAGKTQQQGTPAPVAPGTGGTPAAPGGSSQGSGKGSTKTQTTPAAPAGTQTTPAPAATPQPAPAAADDAIPAAATTARDGGASDAPVPLVLLAILAALLAPAAAMFAAARWWAWEPGWMVRARHAGSEAGWRTSATWAEFTDWLKLGR
jgi:hypothetical protein